MEEPATKRRKIEEIALESPQEGSEATPENLSAQPNPPNRANIFTENCSICNTNLGKYRCPGCDIISCSLDCTKLHRKESLCSGKRSRTEYKEIKQMTDQDFVKDMHLLHQAKESSKTARKVAHKVPGSAVKGLPKKLRVLHQEARRLHINIIFMPAFMKRHKENTTFFDYKRVMILWRCEFIFDALDDKKNNIFTVPNVEDVRTFGELLSDELRGKKVLIPDHLLPKKSNDEDTSIRKTTGAEIEPDTKLRDLVSGTEYETSGPENWIFLLRHEKLPASRPLYHKAFASDNLRRTLDYRDVLEFPSLICLPSDDYLKNNSDKYPIFTQEAFQTLQKQLQQEESAIIARVNEKQREIEEREAQREMLMESRNAGAVKLDMIAKEMGIAISGQDAEKSVNKEMLLDSITQAPVDDAIQDQDVNSDDSSDDSSDDDSSDDGSDESSSGGSSASSSSEDENEEGNIPQNIE